MAQKIKAEEMYATMQPWRLFFRVALPGMISMFAMSIYSIIEGMFIGQNLGEGAFAAVNIAFPLVLINFSLSDLIGVGASVPISIALGKNDHDTANNVFTCSVIMIFTTSLIMGMIMSVAAVPLASLMGAEGELLETSVRYLRTFALCSPVTSVFFAMDNYLKISGYVKTSMIINVCSNVVTIALLSIFLLVLKMDVVGSALASCISMCACSVVALIPFVRNKALLKFTKPKFHFAMFRQIAACGSPIFFSNISGRLTSILINISLMSIGAKVFGEGGGTTAVAIYAVLMYSSDVCWPLLYGIADSLSPAIGYNWGAQSYDRVKKISRCAFIGTAIVGIISTAALYFFSETVATLFSESGDVEFIKLTAPAIRLFAFTYLFRWFVVTTQSYLSAIEKPLQGTFMSVMVSFVLPVVLLGALYNWGLEGIWFNFVGVNMIASVIAAILLLKLGREIRAKKEALTKLKTLE
ncbi:MAG: MATE family efflux transporter [Clostridiales bacterium]|nr:MATE family efflux transporter [Clostridiales bacterium]